MRRALLSAYTTVHNGSHSAGMQVPTLEILSQVPTRVVKDLGGLSTELFSQRKKQLLIIWYCNVSVYNIHRNKRNNKNNKMELKHENSLAQVS